MRQIFGCQPALDRAGDQNGDAEKHDCRKGRRKGKGDVANGEAENRCFQRVKHIARLDAPWRQSEQQAETDDQNLRRARE